LGNKYLLGILIEATWVFVQVYAISNIAHIIINLTVSDVKFNHYEEYQDLQTGSKYWKTIYLILANGQPVYTYDWIRRD